MKQWKRAISMVLTGVLVLGPMAVTAGAAPYTPGTYTATAKGFGGDVTVVMEVNGQSILSLQAEGSGETPGIGSKAIEKLPDAIVKGNSFDVEVVSGATITSNAILAAVVDCLAQAGVKAEPVGAASGSASMKAGLYTAQANGFKGKTTVEVMVSENAILSVSVTETGDTKQIFDSAYPRLTDRIVAAQTLGVDAITGATVTSNAIISAVRSCLTQAGAQVTAFRDPVKKSTETVERFCDVVVVGAGGAGMTAAASAAENGAKVILVEKAAKVGGTASNTTGAMGINPKKLTQTGKSMSREEIDKMFKQWQEESNYKLNGVVLRRFLENSGTTLDWMSEHGFQFAETNKFLTSPYLVNNNYVNSGLWGPPDDKYSYYEKFRDYIISLGADILLETDGKELLLDDDGAAVGVKAVRYDGTTYIINAKSVILATGGYAGNPEMMMENFGYSYKLYGMAQNKGAGIQMGLSAGAALKYPDMLCSHFVGPYTVLTNFDSFDNNILYGITNGTYGLLNVNMLGERFQNEAAAMEQWVEGDYYWTLLTQSQVNTMAKKGLIGLGQDTYVGGLPFLGASPQVTAPLTNIQKVLDYCVGIGEVVRADSIAALAEAAGMDSATLANHVALYNKHCAAGNDATFGKASKYLNSYPEGETAYYAVKVAPYIYSTCGGLNVNEYLQVLREDNGAIPGLYAAGMDSMGVLFGGNQYLSYGGPALGWAFTSGRLAGEHAANQVK